MKACYIDAYGGRDVMRVGELPDPTLRQGQALVQVAAASVNPVDWKIRQGHFKLITGPAQHKVLGVDFAGRVKAVEGASARVAVGDRVYGATQVFGRGQGCHAELVAVAAKTLRPIPEALTFAQAATLPGAALTAINGLCRWPKLDGQRVLVNGATGGVGHFATQIANARGAAVTAVCSAQNADFAQELGAVQALDYQSTNLASLAEAYDTLFDAHGGLGFGAASSVLAKSGTYVTTLAYPRTYLHAFWRKVVGGRQIVAAMMRTHPVAYAELEELVLAGRVKPVIHRSFSLSEAVSAFAALEQGGVRGKIVIQME